MSERFSEGGYIPAEPTPWPLTRRGNLYSENGDKGPWFRILSAEELRAIADGYASNAKDQP